MADRRLQVFHTVARLLSFTKAAESLHMTQPAVTFQVRQLEEHFNTRLFNRTHNRISLTPVGEQVYAYSKRIFDVYVEMDNAVREITGEVSGGLLLGASTTIAEYMLPALLGDFKRKYPDVGIHLRVSNTEGVVAMVESNEIDLGVVEAPVSSKNLTVELCKMDQLVAIAPSDHYLAKHSFVSISDLLNCPYISREEGSGTRDVIECYIEEQGLSLDSINPVMELGSSESIKSTVIAGLGVAILSWSAIQKELQLGTLTAIPLDPPLQRPFSFVHQKQKFRLHAMEELVNFARSYCQSNYYT